MKRRKYIFGMVAISMFIMITANTVFGQQNFIWDKELVQKVTITDQSVIKKLVFELFIPESDITFIEIFDVDKNGAAEGDLLKVHPSRNVYPLYMLSQDTREILRKIPHPPNLEDVGLTINIKNPDDAKERILFILASTIKELYSQDKPLKLYFEQNEDGVYKFDFFGFSEADLKDKDIDLGKNRSQQIHDLLKALYKEFNEEFVSWQPTVIHVIKTERDTLVVPEKISKK
ncbi:MAG: hypothetical protein MUC94_00050 [bacterium]|jgi:hypothetical protein|nr:hypothetical protein [bacterium]